MKRTRRFCASPTRPPAAKKHAAGNGENDKPANGKKPTATTRAPKPTEVAANATSVSATKGDMRNFGDSSKAAAKTGDTGKSSEATSTGCPKNANSNSASTPPVTSSTPSAPTNSSGRTQPLAGITENDYIKTDEPSGGVWQTILQPVFNQIMGYFSQSVTHRLIAKLIVDAAEASKLPKKQVQAVEAAVRAAVADLRAFGVRWTCSTTKRFHDMEVEVGELSVHMNDSWALARLSLHHQAEQNQKHGKVAEMQENEAAIRVNDFMCVVKGCHEILHIIRDHVYRNLYTSVSGTPSTLGDLGYHWEETVFGGQLVFDAAQKFKATGIQLIKTTTRVARNGNRPISIKADYFRVTTTLDAHTPFHVFDGTELEHVSAPKSAAVHRKAGSLKSAPSNDQEHDDQDYSGPFDGLHAYRNNTPNIKF